MTEEQQRIKMQDKQNNWWDELKTIEEPYPHIPESQIMAAMPEELKLEWEDFIRGQTCFHVEHEDGTHEAGIYPWDFDRFTSRLKRYLPAT
jgi:hypothetical protein